MPMFSNRCSAFGAVGFALAALAPAVAAAQTPPPAAHPPIPQRPAIATKAAPVPTSAIPGADIVHFASRIGSFKVLGSDVTPVQGTMDMSFEGTVLVSGLEKGAAVETKGNVRLEKETSDHSRQVYFGKGEIVIKNGRMRSFQFFGKDVQGTFKGTAIFRMFGEFDKKLETGFIWYEGDEHRPWGTGGNQVVVPNPMATAPNAKVRIHPAGG